ncbi:thiamine/thiamine pyrophosphate ABC transporter permease ThiP, partial [Vibrio sp. D420a]|nr:thiamine/thiamine pyrophosphate ABC transporter permease ThiP [Vibrio sp. D420a]
MLKNTPKVGIWVALIITAFVVSSVGGLLSKAPSLDISQVWSDPYYWHVTKFSFYQATLSMLLSVVFAVPVAH